MEEYQFINKDFAVHVNEAYFGETRIPCSEWTYMFSISENNFNWVIWYSPGFKRVTTI